VRSYANLVATVRKLNARGLEGDRVLADLVTFGANHAHRTGDAHARVNGPTRDDYVRTRLDAAFASGAYDYLLYPSVQGFNGSATNGPDTGGTHRLSAYFGYPAIAFPAGWARPDEWSPVEPVGVELLGRRHADMALLQLVQRLQLDRRVIPDLTAGD
jgi:Asp-tRNA(Asn)/Glu-tRNA(Gln) amidotransferase A subunit family amidase